MGWLHERGAISLSHTQEEFSTKVLRPTVDPYSTASLLVIDTDNQHVTFSFLEGKQEKCLGWSLRILWFDSPHVNIQKHC